MYWLKRNASSTPAGNRGRAVALVACAVAALLAACTTPPAAAPRSAPRPGWELGPVSQVSQACAAAKRGNAEVETAASQSGAVYADWIGCGGIGFARSSTGGRTFLPAVRLPGSRGYSWDPSIAVGPDGTVYAAYMHQVGSSIYPVVAVSTDHGASFASVTAVRPPRAGNWGDRDFIAVGSHGTVYLTWDYGPRAGLVHLLCSKGGSCAYAAGDLNAVIQRSTNGGHSFGRITPLGPGFPRNGGESAPLIIAPDGTVDVLYMDHLISPGSYQLHPGQEIFTSSRTGTDWADHVLWPTAGSLSLPAWWINGDITADSAGTLYATWDTQGTHADIGWLTWSANGGAAWSRPVRVTPDTDRAPHIVEVAGGRPGVAYVAWLTSAGGRGYALWLRPYSIRSGWLAAAIRVSPQDGNASVWPGDTFGITVLPGPGAARIALAWGSAVGSSRVSQIWARTVTEG